MQAVSVKVGDRVLLPGWGGSPIKVGEEVSLFELVAMIELIVGIPLVQGPGDLGQDQRVDQKDGIGTLRAFIIL